MPRSKLVAHARCQSDHASASDRLSALSPRMAERGFVAAPLAQLPRRRAWRGLSLRRARAGRARALLDVARTRHAGGNARSAPLRSTTGRAAISAADSQNRKPELDASHSRPYVCSVRGDFLSPEGAAMKKRSIQFTPAKCGLIARIDAWFERRRQREVEHYLATSHDLYELEMRMRALDHVPNRRFG